MHVIFLVHGMGSHKADEWAAGFKKMFKEYYDPAKYAFLGSYPDSNFEFCPINYNELFEKYLDEAKKQAERLQDWNKMAHPIDPDELGVLKHLLGVAETTPSSNFAVTHLADVAFYIATDLGELVKSSITRQITERLLARGFPEKAGNSWSIIAHSLGTRVATEVLQGGFTGNGGLIHFGKARVVMMIANTSNLIEKYSPYPTGNVYRNEVYPANDPALGVSRYYINATHPLDPVASIEEFDPPPTFGNGETAGLYHGIRLKAADVTSKSIHDAEHYLRHPLVHTTLFRFLMPGTGKEGPTTDEMNKALADYQKETLLAPVTDIWRNSLAQLRNRQTAKLAEIFKVWEDFGALIS